MQCLFLSTIYKSHRLPIERRNRENDSRCCLCICLTALSECLWEGGGGWGLHWVNPTAVREPLLLSPLSITWSLFLLSWMWVSGMCIWAHASWNLVFEISRTWFLYLKPFCLTLPGPLCPALLPVALGTSLHCCPMPPSPSLPVIKCIQWFCRERSWSDANAPVGFTHRGILVFYCICSKACRTSDAQCFFLSHLESRTNSITLMMVIL